MTPDALLARSRTIAVVGCSRRPHKAAHRIPSGLQRRGFRIIPVHPAADEILGEKAYASLADIPEAVDLVNVFRPAREAAEVVRQAVGIAAPAVWLQLGIASDEARRIAEDAGMAYIEDDCTGAVAARHGITAPG